MKYGLSEDSILKFQISTFIDLYDTERSNLHWWINYLLANHYIAPNPECSDYDYTCFSVLKEFTISDGPRIFMQKENKRLYIAR